MHDSLYAIGCAPETWTKFVCNVRIKLCQRCVVGGQAWVCTPLCMHSLVVSLGLTILLIQVSFMARLVLKLLKHKHLHS